MQNLATKIFKSVLGFLLLVFSLPVAAQNVGINTTVPTSVLDVNGQITIDQFNFGGYGGLLIKGGDQGSNYPNIAFSTRYPYNGLNADVISASITGIITNSIPGTESIDLGFATSIAGQAGLTNKLIIKGNGNVGIGNNAPHAPLQFSNALVNRKIVLYENTNNDHQFIGFGVNDNMLRYQSDNSSTDHVFFAGISATASKELFRIRGNSNVIINPSNDAPGDLSAGAILFGQANSGEGIVSKRTAGVGQWGLDFYTSSKDRLSIQTNGNIVINPTNDATGGLTSGGALLFGGYNSGEGIASVRSAGNRQNGLSFYTNYGERLFIGNNGQSNFYADISAYNYYVYARGYITTSDVKFKKDIQTIADPIEKIKQLRGVTYNFKKAEYPSMSFGDEKQYGFIAQEVEKIFPEMVKTGKFSKNPEDKNANIEEYKGVEYQKLIPVLLEAIKEQQKQIELLQAKFALLEKK